ncbi:hypothetical protein FOA52_002915 [Chlamydomonas sp. UWO 241]|nr:hypothetical protein FOA52_002915 [Chlamydomonas sp. UWO 241]
MPYIRNGQVQEHPGVVGQVKAFLAALLALIILFFQAIINPDASAEVKKKEQSQRRDGAGGGGGGGGGPRIRGLDRITGGSHAAQCAGGG